MKPFIALAIFVIGLSGLLWYLDTHDDVHTKTHQDYSEVTIDYHGHSLYCVGYDRGVSCDWARWHQETGR